MDDILHRHSEKLKLTDSVHAAMIAGKGRGIIASRAISSGEVVEVALTWKINGEDIRLVNNTEGFGYYFVREALTCSGPRLERHMVFGFTSLVNHSNQPNCAVSWKDTTLGPQIILTAIRSIKENEELTHRYQNVADYPSSIVFI